ncbi:MAG: DUF3137 domain-containing protein [Micavibrio sp.]
MTSASLHKPIHDILLAMQRLAPALERKRKSYNILLLLGTFAIVIIFYGILSFADAPSAGSYIAVVGVAFLPSTFLYKFLNARYQKAVHKKFMEAVCTQGTLSYSDIGFFESREVKPHNILPDTIKSISGEGIRGSYRGITFALQEIMMKEGPATAFWGVVARVYLNHRFEAHTVILPAHKNLPDFALRFRGWEKLPHLPAKLAGSYQALTTDLVEAKAILPAAFLERVMEAGQLPRGKAMSISFQGQEILLAYPRFRPIFTLPALWQPISLEAMQRCIWEIDSILQIIDLIKANHQIRT